MSVITTHHLIGENIKQKLIDAGLVSPGKLYSPKQKDYVSFDYILDYMKCDEIAALKEREYYQSMDKFTDEQLSDLLKMPVHFSEDGNEMIYSLNYVYSDTPAFMVAKAFPDEIFKYCCFREGRLNAQCYIKGSLERISCTKDGRSVFGYIPLSPKQVFDNNSNYKIKLPVNPEDKTMATIYVNTANDIHAQNLYYNEGNMNERQVLCITDMEKKIPVYRTKFDGTHVKEYWSMKDIRDANSECRRIYRESRREEVSRNYMQIPDQDLEERE